MNLTVDCTLTAAQLHLPSSNVLAQLLGKAKVTHIVKPLEAIICEQHGLHASPDYPIAAIAASVDGFEVGGDYFLRADPVHLVLQRDCFSLDEPVPLKVAHEHAEAIIAALNTHFSQDGLLFVLGKSGAWYLRLAQIPQISTTLPSVATGKNVHSFMPQGLESSKWLAVINEVQMLLFEHPVNVAREAKGEPAVNSVWFSSGGVMPPSRALENNDVIVADSAVYRGLAHWTNASYQMRMNSLDGILQNIPLTSHMATVRLQLPEHQPLDEVWFSALLTALKNNKIKKLTLNIGFYEKSLMVEVKPLDLYKFWRSLPWRTKKPVMDYLQ